MLLAAWRMLTGCPTCTKVGEDDVLRGSGAVGVVSVVPERSSVISLAACQVARCSAV